MADIAEILRENGIYGKKAELAGAIAAASPMTCPKRELAEMVSVSEMTVFRYLKSLEEAGIIAIEGARDDIKSYRFLLEQPVEKDSQDEISSMRADIDELKREMAELRCIVAKLLDIVADDSAITDNNNSTTTDYHNIITDEATRARVIVNNKNKGEKRTTAVNGMEGRTETEGARDPHNTSMEPKGCHDEVEIAFDTIWEKIDWMQKLRYGQTRDVQWKHARKVLGYILGRISFATLMERITAAVGEGMVFGKAISYWLKDNVDMLTACETRNPVGTGWRKFESTGGNPGMQWSLIAGAVG